MKQGKFLVGLALALILVVSIGDTEARGRGRHASASAHKVVARGTDAWAKRNNWEARGKGRVVRVSARSARAMTYDRVFPTHKGPAVSMYDKVRAAYHECTNVGGTGDMIKAACALARSARADGTFLGRPDRLGHETCMPSILGLDRYQTVEDIRSRRAAELVSIGDLPVEFGEELPLARQVARPWVREYIKHLTDTLRRFEPKTGDADLLRVTSLIRSKQDQERVAGDGLSPLDCREDALCSTHTTGSAFDISFRMPPERLRRLTGILEADQARGRVFFIKEIKGNHFHVFVVPSFAISSCAPA